MAVYSSYHDMDITGDATPATTKLTSQQLPKIINEGTTNRKIVRIRGIGSLSTTVTGGSVAAMIGFIAHPKLEGVPPVSDFDPFNIGPAAPGDATYKGRPSPRPFGRHLAVLANSGQSANTLFHDFSVSTRAQRLIRPGWELDLCVWLTSIAGSAKARLGLVLNVTVEG